MFFYAPNRKAQFVEGNTSVPTISRYIKLLNSLEIIELKKSLIINKLPYIFHIVLLLLKKITKMKKILLLLTLVVSYLLSVAQTDNIDSLKQELQTLNNAEKVKILNEIAKEYLLINPNKTIEYAQQAINLSQSTKDELNYAIALRTLGLGYGKLDYNKLALKEYQKSLNICIKLDNKNEIAETLSKIGILYKRTNNSNLALETFKECLELQTKLKNTKEIARLYLNIGAVYSMKQEYDTTLYYTKKSIKTYDFEKNNEHSLFATYNNNIGFAYEGLNKLDSALIYYNIAVEIGERTNEFAHLSGCYTNIGYVYLKKANYKLSYKCFEKGLNIAKKKGLKIVQSEIYNGLYSLFIKQKDYKKAADYSRKYIAVYDRLNIISNKAEIEELRLIHDLEKKEEEIKSLNKINKLRLILLFAFIAIVLVIVFLIVLRILYKRKILKAELEKKTIKTEALNNEIEYKTNQLTNFTISILKKNEIFKTIDISFKSIKRKANKEIVKEIAEAHNLIKISLGFAKEEKEFNNQLNEINKKFFDVLNNRYPSLSNNEKNIAALLKINLSSKQIALLKNVEVTSIEHYRYNIRKKLKLKKEDNLSDFLASFC